MGTQSKHKKDKSKSYSNLRTGNETTIKKVAARKISQRKEKRVFSSNDQQIRKNLLNDAVETESAPRSDLITSSSTNNNKNNNNAISIFESGNKATILANFEEWIKLATDNKINVKNSWNFALIDYFHDLNVLRETNGNINFQKASATLDGCIKIYSSRIDSVANETGRLLTGLVVTHSPNGSNKANTGLPFEEGSLQDGDIVIDSVTGLPVAASSSETDGDRTVKRRNNVRVLETTLTAFKNLKVSTFDEEFSIDPLFKKALADFDEAGAKNMLLSILHINNEAEVVFDNTEKQVIKETKDHVENQEICDKSDVEQDEHKGDNISEEKQDIETEEEDSKKLNGRQETLLPSINLEYVENKSTSTEQTLKAIDDGILNLGMSLGLNNISNDSHFCKSINLVRESVNDITKVKALIDNVANLGETQTSPSANTNKELKEFGNDPVDVNYDSLYLDNIDVDAIEDISHIYNDDVLPNNDTDESNHLGENTPDLNINEDEGLLLAKRAFEDNEGKQTLNIDDPLADEDAIYDDGSVDNIEIDFEQNLFEQFSGIFKNKSWTGKDHWKVKNIKKTVNPVNEPMEEKRVGTNTDITDTSKDKLAQKKGKRNKQRPEIDFFKMSDTQRSLLYDNESAKVNGIRKIDIPFAKRKDAFYNLLPTDYHVTLEKMTVLFTRPHQKGNFFRKRIDNSLLSRNTLEKPSTDGDGLSVDEAQSDDDKGEYWANAYELQENPNTNGINTSADLGEIDGVDGDMVRENYDIDDMSGMGLDFNDVLGDDNEMDNLNKNNEEIASKQVLDINAPMALNAGLLLSSSSLANDEGLANKQGGVSLQAMLAYNATQKVNYSRVAKKVDIKKLKDNIWRCIENHLNKKGNAEMLTFSSMTKELRTLYSFDSFKDLSTSFCFICLLHLANERGFTIIKDDENLMDLTLVFN